ncbi:MAG: SurA N-terminal domain-containing protein [Candidatus Aenigmatarchaeota archaeon]
MEELKVLIMAKVNGKPIMADQLNAALRHFLSEYYSGSLETITEEEISQARRIVLENLISKELIYQEGLNKRIIVEDEEVDREMEKLKKDFPSEEEFFRRLEKEKMDYEECREIITANLLINKTIDAFLKNVPPVTEEEVLNYYEKHKNKLVTPYGTLPFEDVKDSIAEFMQKNREAEAIEEWLDELRERADIEIFI